MSFLFRILLFIFPLSSFAQGDTIKIYYNKDYDSVEIDEDYTYYSLTWVDGKKTHENLYFKNGNLKISTQKKNNKRHGPYKHYTKYGQIQWEGQYKNGKKTGKWKEFHPHGEVFSIGRFKKDKSVGFWRFYHENGQLAMKQKKINNNTQGREIAYYSNGNLFNKGKYKNNKRIGKWIWYHENGQIKSIGNISKDGYRTGLWKYYHEDGSLLCNCTFEENESYIKYYAGSDSAARYFIEETIQEVPSTREIMNWKLGFLNGKQVFYYKNGNIAAIEWYKNGKLDSLKNWDIEGQEIAAYLDEKGTLQNPIFNGDFKALEDSVKRYPTEALENNIFGIVDLIFFVNTDGSLSKLRILESPDRMLSEEAIRILKLSSGKWIPGKKHNVPTTIKYGVRIAF